MSESNQTLFHSVPLVLRLYLTGASPRSVLARTNLEALLGMLAPGKHQVEIVDILEHPLRLLTDNIPLTPALVKVEPPPVQMVLGDLSDHRQVLRLLGVSENR